MLQQKTQQLVQQSEDFFTVSEGQVPVIPVDGQCNFGRFAFMAINFLRSGCPKVQLPICSDYDRLIKRAIEEIKSVFESLTLPGENFAIEENFPQIPTLITVSYSKK